MTITITLLILTDISSIYMAKRALTQVTEAAAQRGVRNLDLKAYYRGKYNASQFIVNLLGDGEKDPAIPIDCEKGRADAVDAIREISGNRSQLLRPQIGPISIDEINCDGYQLSIHTSAIAELPFVLPFINLEKVGISSRVGIFDERKVTTNYYGINIG